MKVRRDSKFKGLIEGGSFLIKRNLKKNRENQGEKIL